MVRLIAICVLVPACGVPDLPDRSSPELVPCEPGFLSDSAGGIDDSDDDPAWWDLAADASGWEVWTRQGRLTAPHVEMPGFSPGAIRAFDNGTVLTCGFSGLSRWENDAWTDIPFPELPDLTGEGTPYACFGFVATDPSEAWFVLESGHLCRYDGEIKCADVSTTITADPKYGPRIQVDAAMTESSVFVITPLANTNTTEVYLVDRGADPSTVRHVETIAGQGQAVYAVPGREQAVVLLDDLERRGPVVIGREGIDRSIDIGVLGDNDDHNLDLNVDVVPLPDGIDVVVNRIYSTTECEDGDVGECTTTEHWSEIVVLRDVDGNVDEVGHHGIEGDVVTGSGWRVDGELRIETLGGWFRLGP